MHRFFLIIILTGVFMIPLQALEPPKNFDLNELRSVPILEDGRYKPLDTFAGETIKAIAGRWNYHGYDPLVLLLSLAAFPDWAQEEVIRIDYLPLKEALGLDAGKNYYSYNALAANSQLHEWVDRVSQKSSQNIKLNRTENEVGNLYHRLTLFQSVQNGEAWTLVPPPPGSSTDAAWLAVGQMTGYPPETQKAVQAAFTQLMAAVRSGDALTFKQIATQFKEQLAKLNPSLNPPAGEMSREIHYNHFRPFLNAWIFYLIAFLMFLVAFSFNNKKWYWVSFAAFFAGFAFHSYGLLLRSLISGRPPVSNMYESVVFVGWGIIAFAMVFELVYRERWFAVSASALGVGMLILADILPFDSNIEPLVPVLRSNYWLIIHVLTITLSYSAFALAMGLAHINLGIYFYLPNRRDLLIKLSLFLYRVLQAGVVFLAAGTILGGVWANESWGRFWGWDPKETWALISLLGYLAILHARFTGWVTEFGVAVCSIFGFWLILMTWYGVNFVLSTGLHSYGFGVGGGMYVIGYLVLELLFILGVAWKYLMWTLTLKTGSVESQSGS